MPTFTDFDSRMMRRALALAARARGYVEPNPLVGAVLVKNNKIIAEGYHRAVGGPHAEVHALRAADRRAKGATLYVTLEPCCHFGKTPPCTDAILAAGVSRVVAAMTDPFPKVRGRGARILRSHGIACDFGLLEKEARALNAPFIKRVSTGLPFVIAKWAQTLDGCIATASGESKWISSEESRAQVQILRGRVDAIAVGIGTALADDPLLMARPARPGDIRRLATRVVFDSHCRLPLNSQLVRTISRAPVIVLHATRLNRAAQARARQLADRGVITIAVATTSNGRLSIPAALRHLGHLDYTNILLEGGPELLAAFLHTHQVDQAHIYLAPKLIGGLHARHAVAGPDIQKLAHAHQFQITAIERSGPDLHLTAWANPAKL